MRPGPLAIAAVETAQQRADSNYPGNDGPQGQSIDQTVPGKFTTFNCERQSPGSNQVIDALHKRDDALQHGLEHRLRSPGRAEDHLQQFSNETRLPSH
jgi:hypothetical protein